MRRLTRGVVLIDDRGEPLSNIITWRDQRALEPHPGGNGSAFEHLRQLVATRRATIVACIEHVASSAVCPRFSRSSRSGDGRGREAASRVGVKSPRPHLPGQLPVIQQVRRVC